MAAGAAATLRQVWACRADEPLPTALADLEWIGAMRHARQKYCVECRTTVSTVQIQRWRPDTHPAISDEHVVHLGGDAALEASWCVCVRPSCTRAVITRDRQRHPHATYVLQHYEHVPAARELPPAVGMLRRDLALLTHDLDGLVASVDRGDRAAAAENLQRLRDAVSVAATRLAEFDIRGGALLLPEETSETA